MRMGLKLARLSGEAERRTQTTLDTIEIDKNLARAWKAPPFQREVRVNQKVLALVDQLKREGVLPGILTLGVLDGETYLVDGQHRRHAFYLADLPLVYADVRTHHFTSMGAMAAEYVRLNSAL